MTETLVGVSPPPRNPTDQPSAEELAAAKELVRQARAQGVALTGPGGLLKALTKTVIETALDEEMAEHLGYDKHDPVGRNRGNSRNGKRAKTVFTDSGEVDVEVPRDRDGSFEPVIVAKRQRRLSSIDDIVLSLYARGLTTGDIAAHIAEIYDAQVSKDTISRITDRVIEEMQPGPTGRWSAFTPPCSSTRSCAARRCVTEWRWKTCTAWPSQRLGEAGGSLIRGTPGRVGAALTTTGRASTARWCGSG